MAISPENFRDVLRHFPAGVTIVTIKAGNVCHGVTVSAFTAISQDPPLIMVAVDTNRWSGQLFQKPEATFAVNILADGQDAISNRFASKDADRFAGGNWTTAVTGAPVLADALGWLDCEIYARQNAGTHTIIIGKVKASATARPDEAPLVYWNRKYRKLMPEYVEVA